MGADAMATSCFVVVQLTDVINNVLYIVFDGLLPGELKTSASVEPETSSSMKILRVSANSREVTFVVHVTRWNLSQNTIRVTISMFGMLIHVAHAIECD